MAPNFLLVTLPTWSRKCFEAALAVLSDMVFIHSRTWLFPAQGSQYKMLVPKEESRILSCPCTKDQKRFERNDWSKSKVASQCSFGAGSENSMEA